MKADSEIVCSPSFALFTECLPTNSAYKQKPQPKSRSENITEYEPEH